MSFKAAQASIEKKEGIPAKNAGAILAAGARKASPAAKKKNPNLLKVGGAGKPMGKMKPKMPKSSTDKMGENMMAGY